MLGRANVIIQYKHSRADNNTCMKTRNDKTKIFAVYYEFFTLMIIQWNLDLVTDLVTQKSVTKSWVVTKSMYFMY